MNAEDIPLRLFTNESLARNEKRILEEKEREEQKKAARQALKEAAEAGGHKEDTHEEEEPTPHPGLEQGKPLPKNMAAFPPELFGKPIEEIDEFYNAKNVSYYE